jgi:hypothetical protein
MLLKPAVMYHTEGYNRPAATTAIGRNKKDNLAMCEMGMVCVQMGASMTLGTAIVSLLVPAKVGFIGLLMMFYGCYQESVMPALPALVFVPIFAIATNVLSSLGFGSGARAGRRPVAVGGKQD